MSHTIVGKLNKAANQHQNQSGMTFFVDIGEKNFNFKTKQAEYTNYSAALFAKDAQIPYYSQVLVEGAIISVTGTGLLIDIPDNPEYKPRLQLQDAKLTYAYNPGGQNHVSQQAPQQAPQMMPNAQPPQPHQAQQQPNPANFQPQAAKPGFGGDGFSDDIPNF